MWVREDGESYKTHGGTSMSRCRVCIGAAGLLMHQQDARCDGGWRGLTIEHKEQPQQRQDGPKDPHQDRPGVNHVELRSNRRGQGYRGCGTRQRAEPHRLSCSARAGARQGLARLPQRSCIMQVLTVACCCATVVLRRNSPSPRGAGAPPAVAGVAPASAAALAAEAPCR